jgi:hypothetical protein
LLDWIRRKNPNLPHEILVVLANNTFVQTILGFRDLQLWGSRKWFQILCWKGSCKDLKDQREGTIWILECGSVMHLGYTITLIFAKTKEVIQKVIGITCCI